MNWENRGNAQTREELVEALTDGICKNVDDAELDHFAKNAGIPFQRQGATAPTPPTPAITPDPAYIDSDDVEDEDDEYEDSYQDSYWDSSC